MTTISQIRAEHLNPECETPLFQQSIVWDWLCPASFQIIAIQDSNIFLKMNVLQGKR
jgi:hypothetical protein